MGESSPVSVVIGNVNGSFQVEASGEYEIVNIRDKYCSGIIGAHRIMSGTKVGMRISSFFSCSIT